MSTFCSTVEDVYLIVKVNTRGLFFMEIQHNAGSSMVFLTKEEATQLRDELSRLLELQNEDT